MDSATAEELDQGSLDSILQLRKVRVVRADCGVEPAYELVPLPDLLLAQLAGPGLVKFDDVLDGFCSLLEELELLLQGATLGGAISGEAQRADRLHQEDLKIARETPIGAPLEASFSRRETFPRAS